MIEPETSRSDIRQRKISESPAHVFSAMSNPQRLARWWGPDGFSSTFEEFDLKAGGNWKFTMHGPDGKDYWNEIVFLEVMPDEKVVLEHQSGHHFFLTITFEADGDGTIVGWKQVFDTAIHYRKIADFVAAANEQNLARLQAEVQRGSKYA